MKQMEQKEIQNFTETKEHKENTKRDIRETLIVDKGMTYIHIYTQKG